MVWQGRWAKGLRGREGHQSGRQDARAAGATADGPRRPGPGPEPRPVPPVVRLQPPAALRRHPLTPAPRPRPRGPAHPGAEGGLRAQHLPERRSQAGAAAGAGDDLPHGRRGRGAAGPTHGQHNRTALPHHAGGDVGPGAAREKLSPPFTRATVPTRSATGDGGGRGGRRRWSRTRCAACPTAWAPRTA